MNFEEAFHYNSCPLKLVVTHVSNEKSFVNSIMCGVFGLGENEIECEQSEFETCDYYVTHHFQKEL